MIPSSENLWKQSPFTFISILPLLCPAVGCLTKSFPAYRRRINNSIFDSGRMACYICNRDIPFTGTCIMIIFRLHASRPRIPVSRLPPGNRQHHIPIANSRAGRVLNFNLEVNRISFVCRAKRIKNEKEE